MDDISIIGPLIVLIEIASEASLFYRDIGLLLNPDKCLLIGNVKDRLTIDGVEIPFVNYSSDAFRFLECWLENIPKITEELNNVLMKLGSELDTILSFEIEKLRLIVLFAKSPSLNLPMITLSFFCFECQTSDSLRAPVKIPVEVSPVSSVPLSMEMRAFSSQLKLNKWNKTSFWKFFAKKNKTINYKPKQKKANCSFQARNCS
ncbi:hypothetical protein P9112_001240 [Eukaryota sp. TZLM1-RC]